MRARKGYSAETLLPESLPEHIVKRVVKGPAAAGLLPETGFNLEEHVEGLEKEYITLPLVPIIRKEVQPEMSARV